MAVRRPLIIDGGSIKELPSGDTLPAPGKTAATLTHSGGAITLDVQAADVFAFTAQQASHAFEFTNVPDVASFTLRLTGAEFGSPYALSAASYDSVFLSVGGQVSTPLDFAFNPDGTRLFVLGFGASTIYQYSLSTGYDLSTATYDSVSFSASSQDAQAYSVHFNTDGTKMFILGRGSDTVYQYSLSTGYDLSTATYDSVSFSVSGQETAPYTAFFCPDGTKMYVLGGGADAVSQYSLSSAFDLSTASYAGKSLYVGGQTTSPLKVQFNADGTKLFVLGFNPDRVYQYSLSTGYDLSTATYDSVSWDADDQDTTPYSIKFNPDGSKMFLLGDSTNRLYQYSTLGSASTATFAYPAEVKWPGGMPPTAPGDGETDILEFVSDDGGDTWYGHLKMDAAA